MWGFETEKGFELKESKARAKDRLNGEEKEEDGASQIERGTEREREREGERMKEEWVSGRAARRRRREKLVLTTAMGVPLSGSCEVKSLPWF